jgi:hypothetical protein
MFKYMLCLLVSILAIACNTSSKIIIPKGRYINTDGTIWTSGGTNLKKDSNIYFYSPTHKGYMRVISYYEK